MGGGDGFGVGQPPGGAGGGGSVQLTGGVVVLSQHHCGRGIVGVSVGGGMMMCTYGWMMHSRCSRRPCPWRWCRSPPWGGANTSRRLRCRSSRWTTSRRSRHPPPVPYRDGYPVPLIHAGGITRVRASCGRSSALTSHRAACRSRASCAMAETALRWDDRLNPRSFRDLLHWDVAGDTNWDKITERRNMNQSSEGTRIFDMRELIE